jgi:methionyl-tRNA formyltransferase
MRISILTSSKNGTAAYCLPFIIKDAKVEVVSVIYSEGQLKDPSRHRKNKWKKIRQIGLLGALNGLWMRKWYREGVKKYLSITDLQETCQKYNIPFRTVPAINNELTRELLRRDAPDLVLSLGNPFIASSVFTIPKYGMINMHGEVLPAFQNAQSVIWQIYEGNSETGYTIHKIARKIDGGDILFQEIFPIEFQDNIADTVSYNSAQILVKAAQGIVTVLNNFDHYYLNATAQGQSGHYTTPSYSKYLRILRNHKLLRGKNS